MLSDPVFDGHAGTQSRTDTTCTHVVSPQRAAQVSVAGVTDAARRELKVVPPEGRGFSGAGYFGDGNIPDTGSVSGQAVARVVKGDTRILVVLTDDPGDRASLLATAIDLGRAAAAHA